MILKLFVRALLLSFAEIFAIGNQPIREKQSGVRIKHFVEKEAKLALQKKSRFFCLWKFIVHSGGVSHGRFGGCGCLHYLHVTHDA